MGKGPWTRPGCRGLSPQSFETAPGKGHAPALVAFIVAAAFQRQGRGAAHPILRPAVGRVERRPGDECSLNEVLPHVLAEAVTGVLHSHRRGSLGWDPTISVSAPAVGPPGGVTGAL